MKGIDIPIFFETEESQVLRDVGIETSLSKSEIRTIRFYNIDAITPEVDDSNGKCTMIYSSGYRFISPENIKTITDKIENR
jgi:hypothetical protein